MAATTTTTRTTRGVERAIGERLRSRRTALGLTQEQLAAALDVSYQQVQKYERGSSRIAASSLAAAAARLGVPIAFFFEVSGQQAPPPPPAESGGRQRAALGLARSFAAVGDGPVRAALAGLARAVAERAGPGPAV